MATSAVPNLEPKSLIRPTHWSRDVENAYRYQLAGYRDEFEYKRIRQVTEVRALLDLVASGERKRVASVFLGRCLARQRIREEIATAKGRIFLLFR